MMSNVAIIRNENITPFKSLYIKDFSYSRIDTYSSCRAKYFYTYILKKPRVFSPAATLGNIVHDTLENCIDNGEQLDYRKLKTEYINQIPKWDPDKLIPRELVDAGHTMLDDFFDDHSEKSFNTYYKEMPFSFIIGSYRINGFIDRVDIENETIRIVDYKTSKYELSQKAVPQNLQLGIYALALSNIFPDKEIYAELHYLRSGKKKGHLFSKEDLENVKLKILDICNTIINDKMFKHTSNTRLCSFCDHAASGSCPVGVYRNNKR
jgi:RecB family exonuclease